MAQFNLKSKLISWANTLFGASINDSEDMDDVSAFDEVKTAGETFVENINSQLEEFKEKANGIESMQQQVTDLTTQVENYKTQVLDFESKVVDIQNSYEQKLIKLTADVRKELAKEKISGKENATSEAVTGLDEPTKEEGQHVVTVNAWVKGEKRAQIGNQ